MKYWLLLLTLVSGLSISAQKPVYFVNDVMVSDSTIATSYGIFGKLSGQDLYALKIFDLANNLLVTGTYKDDSLKIPHGDFSYYRSIYEFNQEHETFYPSDNKARFVAAKGTFKSGSRVGRWMEFYPDGKIMTVTTFIDGKKNGFFGTYNPKGKPIETGNYLDDLKNGEWTTKGGKKRIYYQHGIIQKRPPKEL